MMFSRYKINGEAMFNSRSPEVLTSSEYQELSRKKGSKYRNKKPSKIEKASIELALKAIGLPFEREYRFAPDRKFRADWCILEPYKILIEYEGLVFNTNLHKSTGKSGHTTISGYVSNCEKYNLATVLGFRVLRYTAKTYKQVYSDVKNLLGIKIIEI